MSESNAPSKDSAKKLAELKEHLEEQAFESAAGVVRDFDAEADTEAVADSEALIGTFVSELPDGLSSAATVIRVYQQFGDVLPQDSSVFQTLLHKLQRILHVAVPGQEAMSACDALDRALQLFASRLGNVPGFSEARDELRLLRQRSRNVIRSHKEQELQALVATGNLDAALTLCREMIDEGISRLAAGVLPILEREGASPAAVAYLLSAAEQPDDDDAESLDSVTWEPVSPPVVARTQGPDTTASRPSSVQQPRRAWELTFQDIPERGVHEPEAVDRASRPSPHEAAWTSPGKGEAPRAEARPPDRGVRGEGAPASRRRSRVHQEEDRDAQEANSRPPGTHGLSRGSASIGEAFRRSGRMLLSLVRRPHTREQTSADRGHPPKGREADRSVSRSGFLERLRHPTGRWVSAGFVVLLMGIGWWLYALQGPAGNTGRAPGHGPVPVSEATDRPSAGPLAEGQATHGTPTGGAAVAKRPTRTRSNPDVPDPAQRPQGPPGSLTIDIEPPDSLELYLNGNLVPDGKIDAQSVPPGKQIVVVYREGYEPLRKELWVDPNASVNDTIVLSRSPRLTLAVTPDVDATVRLDGRRMWVKLPISDVAIPVGKHHLEVSRKGFKTWSKDFEAQSDQNLSFEVQLEPGRG